uniref:Uncharacterized protein n=1 Tax=Vespula pensylvanica TaxID=30213 RepID=A0A834P412_VESPE|nr:hypothetical protein H0235_006983 [Vespula pensylvanica]
MSVQAEQAAAGGSSDPRHHHHSHHSHAHHHANAHSSASLFRAPVKVILLLPPPPPPPPSPPPSPSPPPPPLPSLTLECLVYREKSDLVVIRHGHFCTGEFDYRSRESIEPYRLVRSTAILRRDISVGKCDGLPSTFLRNQSGNTWSWSAGSLGSTDFNPEFVDKRESTTPAAVLRVYEETPYDHYGDDNDEEDNDDDNDDDDDDDEDVRMTFRILPLTFSRVQQSTPSGLRNPDLSVSLYAG